MSRSLSCVDGLAVLYLGGTAALLALGWDQGGIYRLGVGLHVGLILGILALRSARTLPCPLRQGRALYPLLLLLLFYVEVDLYVALLHDPPGYDALVRAWDAGLFGAHPHVVLPRWLSGRLWREAFHLLYLSYYLLVTGSFLAVWNWWPAQFPRFAFVTTGMFASFMVLFVLFPVTGPLGTPGTEIASGGVAPRLVAWLYAPLRANGIATGAFPSSHVGMSVGIACLLRPRAWGWRAALWALVLGIAASTVYGQFHYAVDAVAGGVTGALLYLGWAKGYALLTGRRGAPTDPAAEEGGPVGAVEGRRAGPGGSR